MIYLISTAKVLILNEKYELLVLKIGEHTQRPERSYTNDLPGGFINDGEPEVKGALREVSEETGINLDPSNIDLVYGLSGYYNNDRPASVTHLTYLAVLDYTPDVTLSREHESYSWVPFAEALELFEIRPHYQQAIRHVQQYELFKGDIRRR